MPTPAQFFLVVATVVFFMHCSRLLLVSGDFLSKTIADCPLDLTWSNFTWATSACSSQNQRAKCCRYLNAFVAVSVARYASTTGTLGVPSALNDACLSYVSETFESYGIPHNATLFCGVGPKIHVSYQCQGRTSVSEFLQSLDFVDVIRNCEMPLATESSCRRCLNSGIIYLHHIVGAEDNVTLNTCRDAAFVALANQRDSVSSVNLASCFFSIKELQNLSVNAPRPSSQLIAPAAAPSVSSTKGPSQHLTDFSLREHHGTFRPGLIPGISIIVTGLAIVLVIVLVLLIRKKSTENANTNSRSAPPRSHSCKCQEGLATILKRFNYKEIKKGTNNFQNIIARGGFETIYKAYFDDGSIAAIKRVNKAAEYCRQEIFQEEELLSRLHHRHLVALRGFCVERCERFLIYEYMECGSLKDHLHTSEKSPLTWPIRIQIAIDVASALEYLHFYCDPPLCHRDVKSSNILLDKNFLAKVSDFGLAHASTKDSSVSESINVYIQGTPGYIDPEYVETQELTEKSDVYSYGVLLLELVTGRHVIQDNQNLVGWSQAFFATNPKLSGLVDPRLGEAFDEEQLQTLVGIVKWCTQTVGSARPSIKQVLRLLYENLDPMHGGFAEAVEYEGIVGPTFGKREHVWK